MEFGVVLKMVVDVWCWGWVPSNADGRHPWDAIGVTPLTICKFQNSLWKLMLGTFSADGADAHWVTWQHMFQSKPSTKRALSASISSSGLSGNVSASTPQTWSNCPVAPSDGMSSPASNGLGVLDGGPPWKGHLPIWISMFVIWLKQPVVMCMYL